MKYIFISFLSIGIFLSANSSGCGDGTNTNSTGGNTGTSGSPLGQLRTEHAKLFCAHAYSCCNMSERAQKFDDLDISPTNEAECVAEIKPIYESEVFSKIEASLSEGRQSYDGTKAAACYESLKGRCDVALANIFEVEPACNSLFVGFVADGGECTMNNDCAGATSYCADVSNNWTGTCTIVPKEGEPCPYSNCADGLICASGPMDNVCLKRNSKADGQICYSYVECVSDYCDIFSSSTCMAKKAIGSICMFSDECKDGYCDKATSTCAALKAEGQACKSEEECQSLHCDLDTKLCAAALWPICDGN